MPDVIEQLRSYGEAVEQAVEPVNVDEPRRRRPLLLAAAVLVVLAGAATAVWVLRAGGEDAEPPVVSTVPTPDDVAGWRTLDPGPLAPREGSATVWTGDELVVWGGTYRQDETRTADDGAAYDPDAGTWRTMSPAPMSGGDTAGVWTGDEVLLWSVEPGIEPGSWSGSAWDPDTDTWRALTPPRGRGTPVHVVWTGEEMVAFGIDAAYDPSTDRWRTLPGLPVEGSVEAAAWTGEEVVALVANRSDPNYPPGEAVAVAYDPDLDEWHELPATGVSENGVDMTWDGHALVAVDYQMQGSTWSPGDDRWRPLPPLPLRFYECGPTIERLGDTVLVTHCSGYAVLTRDRQWAIGPPPEHSAAGLIPAGTRVFSRWSTDDAANFPSDATTYLQSYSPEGLDDLALGPTIPVGTVLLDLPPDVGLEATNRFENGTETRLAYVFNPDCFASSSYGGPPAVRIRNITQGTAAELGTKRLQVDLGDWTATVARVQPGELDDDAHILLEETTSDLLEITCTTLPQAERLLAGIHR